MSSLSDRANNLYAMPTTGKDTNMPNLDELNKVRADSIDMILWSTAQQNALSKIDLFTKMAKKINDEP